jgi:stress-induced morphogen
MVEGELIVEKVQAALGAGTEVHVEDLTGTLDHWRALIISPAFEGKLLIKRHRMVNSALADELRGSNGAIHALTLETYTPAEWAGRNK